MTMRAGKHQAQTKVPASIVLPLSKVASFALLGFLTHETPTRFLAIGLGMLLLKPGPSPRIALFVLSCGPSQVRLEKACRNSSRLRPTPS